MTKFLATHAIGARRHSLAIGLVLSVAISVGVVSCSKREQPLAPTATTGGNVYIATHVFCENAHSQFGESFLGATPIKVYTPPGYRDQALGRPYPVLYIQTPFRGSEDFYLLHGLHHVADRLIAEGVIEPMIIVFVNSANSRFKGSFCGQYEPSGDYLTLNSTAIISHISFNFNTLEGEPYRGISGYEMGGYSAFRLALTSPERFGSVSAVSSPLYFTHPTYGFPALFDDAVAEWHSFPGDNSRTTRIIDTAANAPASGLLLAAAIAFTPEDTAWDITINNCNREPDNGPTSFASSLFKIVDTAATPRTRITFSQLPVPSLLEDDKLRLFVPFDSAGTVYPYIWNIWNRYDIYRLVDSINTISPTIISNLSSKVLVMATKDARFNHYYQDSLFVEHFNTVGSGADFRSYQAYDGFADENGERFLYEVWPTLLKFHSDKFHATLPANLKLANYTLGY